MELDEEQQRALQSNIRLIEAGPGAGKTRTIVERFAVMSGLSSSGVALVSFTNAAINEARKRCSSELLKYPNFVGTLDSFLHRYIVTPSFIRTNGISPVYVRSWDEYKDSEVFCQRIRRKISLESFSLRFQENNSYSVEIRDGNLRNLDEDARNKITGKAQRKLLSFLKKGIMSCEYAKQYALFCLYKDNGIACRLNNRFSEIIIDEFQDCSSVEVQIVELLNKAGIHMVSVADPYQGIYGFRGVSSSTYKKYKESTLSKYPESGVELDTNYRSVQAICSFISKLRIGADNNLVSAIKGAEGELSVLVGTEDEQLQQFKQLIAQYGIHREEAIILAHSRKNARSLAGRTSSDDIDAMSGGALSRILRALFLLHTSIDSLTKANAVREAIRVIVDSYKWDESVHASYEDKLTALGISANMIRYLMVKLASFLINQSEDLDRGKCSEYIQQCLSEYLPNQALDKSTDERSIPQRFPKIKEKDWRIWENCINVSDVRHMIQCSHIHAVKGEEFEAVLLSSKHSRNTIPIWDVNNTNALADGEDAEVLRTFYVGASRAKRVLAIGVDKKNKDRLLQWLSTLELRRGDDYHVYPSDDCCLQNSLDL